MRQFHSRCGFPAFSPTRPYVQGGTASPPPGFGAAAIAAYVNGVTEPWPQIAPWGVSPYYYSASFDGYAHVLPWSFDLSNMGVAAGQAVTDVRVVSDLWPPHSGVTSFALLGAAAVHTTDVEIDRIEGLRPAEVGNFDQAADPTQGGRLFIDTRENWDGGALVQEHYDKQRAMAVARVKLPPGANPADYKVRWELRDPDDRASHADIDPNGNFLGGDNTGTVHEGAAHWFSQAEDAISDGIDRAAVNQNTVIGEAKTALRQVGDHYETTVYFNPSDDGGDNFVIKAVLMKGNDDHLYGDDSTGTLTMWRKRFVEVSAMEKLFAREQQPFSDVQVMQLNEQGQPNEVCVRPEGASKVSNTMILGGDDRYETALVQGRLAYTGAVTTGPNGKCETLANSGGDSYYPGRDREQIAAVLRSSYASDDPNRNAYLDFEVTDGKQDMAFSSRSAQGLSAYLDQQLHPLSDVHADNTYYVSGVYDVGAYGITNFKPHSVIGVFNVSRDAANLRISRDDFMTYTLVHELGHALVPGDGANGLEVHGSHSNAPDDLCVGYQTSDNIAAKRTLTHVYWCPAHVRVLRSDVTRSWSDHNPAVDWRQIQPSASDSSQ